jgi:flavin-dependent dehydrogenase
MTAGDAEAIVVGGGPAGSAIAAFLARAGADVLLLDRARFPRDKPCAEYLSPEASRVLDALGVLGEVERAALSQLAGMRVTAPNGVSFLGTFAAAHGFHGFRDRGLALRRTTLDTLLLRHASAMGARVEEETLVTGVVRTDGRVTGVEVRSERGNRRLSARLVIGADGLRTVVGRRLGLTRVGRWPRRIAFVGHHAGVRGMSDVGEMHVFEDGYVGLADVGGGLTNVAVVVPSNGWRRWARDRRGASNEAAGGRKEAATTRDALVPLLDAWLADRGGLTERLRGSTRCGPPRATGPFNTRSPVAWTPGAALVGDAADFFDPFTGEGIYAALRGAQVLLPYAWDALRQASASHHDVALAAYDRARRAEFKGKWRVERMVGMAVGFPRLMNHVARRLAASRDLADLLVGVAGDFVPPSRVLRPGFLRRTLF